MIDVRIYQDASGRALFDDWLLQLRDREARGRILTRIARIRVGLLNDFKSVGGGVQELRIDHGPGCRVYFGRRGDELVILLLGGDKRTQAADIAKAKEYWNDWKKREGG